MNYDRRTASNPQFPTLEEAMVNAFQGWCLSAVLYGLRDDQDFVFDNASMKKGGKTFSIEGFPRDAEDRADPLRRFQLTFTLRNEDKIAAEAEVIGSAAKRASERWVFPSDTHYDDASKAMTKFLSAIEMR